LYKKSEKKREKKLEEKFGIREEMRCRRPVDDLLCLQGATSPDISYTVSARVRNQSNQKIKDWLGV